MENKKYIIISIIIFCVCFLLIGYFNYENISNFFGERKWEIADSFDTLNIENVTQVEGGKCLAVLTTSDFKIYKDSAKPKYEEKVIATSMMVDTNEDYMVVALKDINEIYLFKDSELLWKNKFKWDALNVSVNKNGYVTVIYSKSGSKSSIKTFKPSGEEFFTYLDTVYAIDTEMSSNNKYIYIAELNTEGIKIKSNIKIIEVIRNENNYSHQVQTLELGEDCLISDIEYSSNGELLVVTDSKFFKIVEENKLVEIVELNKKDTLIYSIKDLDSPVSIEKNSTNIFSNDTILKIWNDKEEIDVLLNKIPQSIDTMKNVVALNLGDEVEFFNLNGKLIKRYNLENQLLNVKLYQKGTLAALIFRDRIEFIKL